MSTRPVVPGFHPDPSVCRVDRDFYLVNSSFEYLPGVPLRHSRDLRSWTLVGNVLDRPDQMPASTTGRGIFAPTIRHHAGRFWLVTTDVDRIAAGQLLVCADDPVGPWSTASFVAGAVGIDPDLAWDDDGRCFLTWARRDDGPSIAQAQVDLDGGRLLGAPRTIWRGTGLAHTEGPHLYRRGSWWYLVVAEGGTERGHGVSVARAREITGPFQPHPANPVLSHRSLDHPVQNTGHADLVDLPDGSWAMVHLGVRPRGVTPGFHVNGRETFLAGIDWVDDWPVVDEDRWADAADPQGFSDDFSSAQLHPRWVVPGGWAHDFTAPAQRGGLRMAGAPSPSTALLARVDAAAWTCSLSLADGDAALLLRLDDQHFVRVSAVGASVVAELGVAGRTVSLGGADRPQGPLDLTIRAVEGDDGVPARSGPDQLVLGWATDGGATVLATVDGRYTSTEVAGGFTGRTIGPQLLGACARVTGVRMTPVA